MNAQHLTLSSVNFVFIDECVDVVQRHMYELRCRRRNGLESAVANDVVEKILVLEEM